MRKLAICLSLTSFLLLTPAFGAAKKAVNPPGTASGRPFSSGIMVGDTLYVSGTTGPDAKTKEYPEEFEQEVKNALNLIGNVLKEGGMDFKNAVAVQVYLTDMDLFQRMNAVYVTYFPDPKPTRTTVGVARLGGKARIEITVTAHK